LIVEKIDGEKYVKFSKLNILLIILAFTLLFSIVGLIIFLIGHPELYRPACVRVGPAIYNTTGLNFSGNFSVAS